MEKIRKDISGKRFNMWTVICLSHRDNGGNAYWLCRCNCGKEKPVYLYSLTSGKSTNCGCERSKKTKKIITKHGQAHDDNTTYRTWKAIRARCNNEKSAYYKNYGGRGIEICERWNDYKNFYLDMGKKPSKNHNIDRIDNNKGYSPQNCRWVLPVTNSENTSRSKWWVINGKRYSSSIKAAKTLGISASKVVSICEGNFYGDKRIQPKPGCFSFPKYEKQSTYEDKPSITC